MEFFPFPAIIVLFNLWSEIKGVCSSPPPKKKDVALQTFCKKLRRLAVFKLGLQPLLARVVEKVKLSAKVPRGFRTSKNKPTETEK